MSAGVTCTQCTASTSAEYTPHCSRYFTGLEPVGIHIRSSQPTNSRKSWASTPAPFRTKVTSDLLSATCVLSFSRRSAQYSASAR